MRCRREAALAARLVALGALLVVAACEPAAQRFAPVVDDLGLPVESQSVRFAVFGDTGTGGRSAHEIGRTAALYHAKFPFDFALLLGDNLYGRERPQDYERKFTLPFAPLLDRQVQFYAVLGNHDGREQRFFAPFHMGGRTYHAFRRGNVRFFALESDYMTPEQLAWLEEELRGTGDDAWKICFLHHPLYSSGATHGSSLALRRVLEPVLVRHGVDVVFSGHEHSYERFKPQRGVTYIVAGAAARLSRGNVRGGAQTAAHYHVDNSFVLVAVDGADLWFRAIARTGAVVDAGLITRRDETSRE